MWVCTQTYTRSPSLVVVRAPLLRVPSPIKGRERENRMLFKANVDWKCILPHEAYIPIPPPIHAVIKWDNQTTAAATHLACSAMHVTLCRDIDKIFFFFCNIIFSTSFFYLPTFYIISLVFFPSFSRRWSRRCWRTARYYPVLTSCPFYIACAHMHLSMHLRVFSLVFMRLCI